MWRCGPKPEHEVSCGLSPSLDFIPKILGKPLETLTLWNDVIKHSFLKGHSDYIVENMTDGK